MTIKITRQSAFSGFFGKLKLKIDGQTNIRIKSGETKEVALERREAVLQVKEFGTLSNKLTVNEGDHVEIIRKSWGFWYSMFISFITGIYLLFSPVAIWISFILIIIIANIPFFLFPLYELNKID